MVQTPPDAKVIGDLRRQIRAADTEGDFAEQVRLLRTLCDLEVNDLRSRQRLGHLLRDLGHYDEAVLVLQQCASGYAMEGFLNRSIQIVKTLIELNPGDQVALRALQGLYARRRSQRCEGRWRRRLHRRVGENGSGCRRSEARDRRNRRKNKGK